MDDRCGNCGHGPEYHDNGLLCIECDCRRYRNTLRSTKPSLTRITVDHVPGMRVQKSTIPGAVPDCYTPTCSCGWVGEREYDEVPAHDAWIAHATIADSKSDTPADTTTDHARDDAFAEGWHRGRDHQSELGQRRAGGAVRVSDSSQPSGERWDKTTDLPVRADSPDSHPEHDDPSRTGREATTSLASRPTPDAERDRECYERGYVSGEHEERARIERIIEDERRTHRILDTRENGFVVAVLDNLIAAIRQEASDA